MITSFRVGAIFEIKDLATPVITRITAEMRQLTATADRLKTVLSTMGQANFGGLSGGVAAANTEVSSLSRRLATGTRNADAYALALDRAAVAARNLAAASATVPRLPLGGGAGVPGGGAGGSGGGTGGGGGGGGGRHGPGHFGRIGGSLPVYGGHVHGSVASNGALIGGGVAGYVAYKAMHASEDLIDQQDKMRRQGRSEEQIQSITNQAFNDIARQVPTASASEILKSVAELTFTTGTFEGGVAEVADALKIDALLGNATGRHVEGQGFKIYRALEEKLVTQDKGHTNKLKGIMAQGSIATGGKVSGDDWFTFARRAGTSWIGASDEEIGTVIPTLIQSLGPDTAGTSYQTMHMALMGAGTLSSQQFDVLKSLHLIDESKVHHDKGGRVNVGPGGIIGSLETNGSQSQWGRRYLAPAIAGLPAAERESINAKIGRNRNTMRMFEMFSDDAGIAQFDKDAALIKQAWGIDPAYSSFISKDPKGATEGFSKQFTSMMEALGGPAMKTALPGINAMTSMFTSIAAAANAHPKAAGTAVSTLSGIAAGALLGAGIGFLTAGPAGLLAGGIYGGLAGGFGGATYAYAAQGEDKAANAEDKKLRTLSNGWFTADRRRKGATDLGLVGEGAGFGSAPGGNIAATITVKAETDEPNHLAEKIAKLLAEYLSMASKHNQGPGDGINDSIYNNAVGVP